MYQNRAVDHLLLCHTNNKIIFILFLFFLYYNYSYFHLIDCRILPGAGQSTHGETETSTKAHDKDNKNKGSPGRSPSGGQMGKYSSHPWQGHFRCGSGCYKDRKAKSTFKIRWEFFLGVSSLRDRKRSSKELTQHLAASSGCQGDPSTVQWSLIRNGPRNHFYRREG